MSIKETVKSLQASAKAQKEAIRQAEKDRTQGNQHELIRLLKRSGIFLEACNAENALNEVNAELLDGEGIIEKISGIFTYTLPPMEIGDRGGTHTESPVAGISLTWQKQGQKEGIFAGAITSSTQIGSKYTDNSELQVFTTTPESGNEAAKILDYLSRGNSEPIASVSAQDKARKSKRQLIIETEQAISIAVVEHINRGNIEQPK